MTLIEPGRKAPTFKLLDQNDEHFNLGDHEDHAVVLFFYPKDCTSGCTREAQDFSAMQAKFREAGAEVVGVSILDSKSKAKFVKQAGLKLRMLADDHVNADRKPDPKIARKYGVWVEKSMYGKTYMGLQRTTYLIGPGRKVIERWDKVKVPNHAEQALEQVKKLGLDPLK
ncbi:MAG: peroxiredoxin [Phycisphaerales bacterium]